MISLFTEPADLVIFLFNDSADSWCILNVLFIVK